MKIRNLILALITALVLVTSGYWASRAWQQYQAKEVQNSLHAEIASIRSYQEAYALRHGHFLLLPDSCSDQGTERWAQLGKGKPKSSIGCFRVVASSAATNAATAPTMQIIAENRNANLRGVEGHADRRPTWSNLSLQ